MQWQTKHRLRRAAAQALEGQIELNAYQLSEPEFLVEMDAELEAVVGVLREAGYHYQALAAIKYHTDDRGWSDDGSWARIPETHPPAAEDSALVDLDPSECQYHVHPFERENRSVTELWGHYEIHPYPWRPHWSIERMDRHYNGIGYIHDVPREEWTYLRGVVDEQLENAINKS